MGLNRAIKERVESMQITDELTKRIHIKMSGCPNGCSQHHIANIGFYGASLKVGEPPDARLHPAHRRQLRGRRGDLRHAAEIAAAGQTGPRGGRALDRLYEAERNEGEEFNAFAERTGAGSFEAMVKDLTLPAEFSLETMQQFIDWNRSSPYKVERGEGECAI